MNRTLRLALIVILLLTLVLGAVGGYTVFGSNTPTYDDTRGVKIPPGSSFQAVLDSLDAAGVVASTSTLAFVGGVTGWKDQVKAGYYTFDAGASNYTILSTLRRGLQTPIRVRIPAGTRLERIAAIGGRDMAFGPDAFLEALRSDSLAAAVGVEREEVLGYLLPDTYFFFWLTPPDEVVSKIKQTFDRIIEQNGPLPDGMTAAGVATLASIVEWETAVESEKARVAGVYLNRLRIGMPLQADPTVQFGVQELEGQKRELFIRDYKLQHPYNTYLYTGLPPGPITNPSASSVKAVLKPEQHDYLYFVASAALDGTHAFGRTLAEHNRNAQAFYRAVTAARRARAEREANL